MLVCCQVSQQQQPMPSAPLTDHRARGQRCSQICWTGARVAAAPSTGAHTLTDAPRAGSKGQQEQRHPMPSLSQRPGTEAGGLGTSAPAPASSAAITHQNGGRAWHQRSAAQPGESGVPEPLVPRALPDTDPFTGQRCSGTSSRLAHAMPAPHHRPPSYYYSYTYSYSPPPPHPPARPHLLRHAQPLSPPAHGSRPDGSRACAERRSAPPLECSHVRATAAIFVRGCAVERPPSW